jgi:2-iminobutanoate/2-iminopropanoate deaminase
VRNLFLIIAGLMLLPGSAWPQFKVERKFLYPPAFQSGKPYSPGVLVGKTLYISGQVDKDPKTGAQPGGIAEQTRLAMNNLGLVLKAAGMDYGNVVSCHVQLADMGKYKEMNEVYGSFFGPDHYPAAHHARVPRLAERSQH